MRSIVYAKLSTPKDEGFEEELGFTSRGSIMEDHVTVPMIEYAANAVGGKLLYAGQSNQTTFFGKGVPLSCTPDGILVDMPRNFLANYGVEDIGPDQSVVTEFKSVSPRVDKSKLPKRAHILQTQVQNGMFRAATDHKPDYGIIIYVDSDKYTDVNVFVVKHDPVMFKALVRRADQIIKCKDPNTVPPEGKIQGGSECTLCPYARRCLGHRPYVPDEDPRALPSKKVAKVAKAAAKAKEMADCEEAFRLKKLEAEHDLYTTLAEVGRRTVIGKDFSVSAKVTKSQSRLDAKALAAEVKRLGGDPDKFRKDTKEGTSLIYDFK